MVVADASLSSTATSIAVQQQRHPSPARRRHGTDTSGAPAARENAVLVQRTSRVREVTSRFRAASSTFPPSTPTVSSSASNCSQNTVVAAVDAAKRAASTERPRHAILDRKAPVNSSRAAAALSGVISKPRNGVFSSLQIDSARRIPKAKREETKACDQTLRPSGNGAGCRLDPLSKKDSSEKKLQPERKGTPLKRPTVNQAENALPSESLNLMLNSRRWPSARNGKGLPPAVDGSVDLSSLKSAIAGAPVQDQARTPSKSIRADSHIFRNGSPSSTASFSKQNPTHNRSKNMEGTVTKAKAIVLDRSITQSEEMRNRTDSFFEPAQLASFEFPLPLPLNDTIKVGRLSLGAARPGSSTTVSRSPLRAGGRGSVMPGGIQVPARFLQIPSCKTKYAEGELKTGPSNSPMGGVLCRDKKTNPHQQQQPRVFTEFSSNSIDIVNLSSKHTRNEFTDSPISPMFTVTSKEKIKQHHHLVTDFASNSTDSVSYNTSLVSPRLMRPRSPLLLHPASGTTKQEKHVRPPSPSRGAPSPLRKRMPCLPVPSSISRNRSDSAADIDGLMGRKVVMNQQDQAQSLRLLQNRLIQWRFVNACAEEAMKAQKAAGEKALVNVWLKTFDLQTSVAMQRIKLQKAKQLKKLELLLLAQRVPLEHWEMLQKDHLLALDAITGALEASTLRIPLTGGIRADLRSMREAFSCAVDVVNFIEPSVRSLLPKGEKVSRLLSELTRIAMEEKDLAYECGKLLSNISSFEMEERSLRAHLLQVENENCRSTS